MKGGEILDGYDCSRAAMSDGRAGAWAMVDIRTGPGCVPAPRVGIPPEILLRGQQLLPQRSAGDERTPADRDQLHIVARRHRGSEGCRVAGYSRAGLTLVFAVEGDCKFLPHQNA